MTPSPETPAPRAPSPLRQALRRGLSAALPRRLFMVAGPPSARGLALTFDDGPHPEHTPVVLDRLRELGVSATFFVVGERAEAHPALVARIVAEGHALGHHSWSHARPEERAPLSLVSEARRTAALLERLAGARPRLFRPPFGKVGAGELAGLWALGQTVVLWNRDPKDFASGDAAAVRRWFDTEPLAGGDILLLHDVHAHVAPALDAVVARARRAGLGFSTPAEWLA